MGVNIRTTLLWRNYLLIWWINLTLNDCRNLEKSLASFHPDVLVYNAGTDILEGDSLGLLSVSALVSSLLYNNSALIIIYSLWTKNICIYVAVTDLY